MLDRLFRKPPPTLDQQLEAAVDEVNRLIPFLPRGVSFWMEWEGGPRLTLASRPDRKRLYP